MLDWSSNSTTAIEARYTSYIFRWTGKYPNAEQLARFFRIQRAVEACGKATEQVARKVMGLEYDGAGWEIPFDYRVQPAPLAHQQNALRVEFIPPSTRCALKPLTDGTRRVSIGHPVMTERNWSNYGVCRNPDGCSVCRLAHTGALGQKVVP